MDTASKTRADPILRRNIVESSNDRKFAVFLEVPANSSLIVNSIQDSQPLLSLKSKSLFKLLWQPTAEPDTDVVGVPDRPREILTADTEPHTDLVEPRHFFFASS